MCDDCRLVGNLPLILGNDFLWSVLWRMIVLVAALVSNQWEIRVRSGRFPTKCLNSEIFSTFLTGNLECFYIFHQNELVFRFPTLHRLEVSTGGVWHFIAWQLARGQMVGRWGEPVYVRCLARLGAQIHQTRMENFPQFPANK